MTVCMLSIVSQAQTTSVSLGQTSSEVHACGLGSSSFTDESRFNLRRSDGRNRVYRRRGEYSNDVCVRERGQLGGGSIMVWAGIAIHIKKNPMVPIHQNLNATRYQNIILRPVAIPHITTNFEMFLMQDETTPHTARTTQQVLQGHNIRILDWSSCSPDLNPIEYLWKSETASSAAEPYYIWRDTSSTFGIIFHRCFYSITRTL